MGNRTVQVCSMQQVDAITKKLTRPDASLATLTQSERNFAQQQRVRKGAEHVAAPLKAAAPAHRPPAAMSTVPGSSSSLGNASGAFGQPVMATPEVVQYIYQALVDWADFAATHHLTWYITFGTLIGAMRDQAMVAWDYDADATVLVESEASFWSDVFPLVRAALCARGYRVLRCSSTYVKILPVEHVSDPKAEWWEAKAATVRQHIDKPLARGPLSAAASKLRAKGNLHTTGQTALDLHIVEAKRNGSVLDWKRAFNETELLPVRMRKFGPLRVPAPKCAESMLDLWYPGWRRERVYKDPVNGKTCAVPPGFQLTALPAQPLARLHAAVQ
jgi:hypothetical protein